MRIFYLLLLTVLMSASCFAGDFKVKIRLEMVDHQSPKGCEVIAYYGNEEVSKEKTDNDGDANLKLEEGRIYDIWIRKDGYKEVVIHNVHANGEGKFKFTMYRSNKKLKSNKAYSDVIRIFDEVKELTIDASVLGDTIALKSPKSLKDGEDKLIKDVKSDMKTQEKAQKKIDKLNRKVAGWKAEMAAIDADIKEGKIASVDGEKKRLDLQESITKAQKEIEKLQY